MDRVEKRGVIVFLAEQGDAHRRVYLYTEEGTIDFIVYGSKSSKAHTKSSLSLFTMGNFIFSTGSKNTLRFVDAQIYTNGMSIAKDIHVYYAACVGAEMTRKMVGAEHKFQFKLLVDFFLYLITHNTVSWRIPLIIFLWRSLQYNGWQPIVPDREIRSRKKYLQYHYTNGFSLVDGNAVQEHMVDYEIIKTLVDNQKSSFVIVCDALQGMPDDILKRTVSMLLFIWQHSLGHTLRLAKFVV